MKHFLIVFLFASLTGFSQVKTDGELTTQSNVIRNETTPKANTSARNADMLKAIIDSKLNINQSQYILAGGTDTYTGSLSPPIASYVAGQKVWVNFSNVNTGASTLNLNSLGAKSIVKNVSTPVAAGDLSGIKQLVYNGTNFQLTGFGLSSVAFALGVGGTDANVSGSPLGSNGTITLNLPSSSAVNRGLLTAADYITFTNKANKTLEYVVKIADHTLGLGDENTKGLLFRSLGSITCTIPLYTTANFPQGTQIYIKNDSVGPLTIAGAVGTALESAMTPPFVLQENEYAVVSKENTTNTWSVLIGSDVVGGGGITNGAASTEIPISDGTNLDPSGLASPSTANLNLGLAATAGTDRTIGAAGSGSNINIIIDAKGTGAVDFTNQITKFTAPSASVWQEIIYPTTNGFGGTRGVSGSTNVFEYGTTSDGTYGGTINTLGGSNWYIYDFQGSAKRFGIGPNGDTYIGASSSSFGFKFFQSGNWNVTKTVTAGGTTGNQTINKLSGTVNIAAAGTTVTVTNSFVTTSSIVFCVVRTNDTTAKIKNVVPGSGSFVVNMDGAVTAETSVGFFVVN